MDTQTTTEYPVVDSSAVFDEKHLEDLTEYPAELEQEMGETGFHYKFGCYIFCAAGTIFRRSK